MVNSHEEMVMCKEQVFLHISYYFMIASHIMWPGGVNQANRFKKITWDKLSKTRQEKTETVFIFHSEAKYCANCQMVLVEWAGQREQNQNYDEAVKLIGNRLQKSVRYNPWFLKTWQVKTFQLEMTFWQILLKLSNVENICLTGVSERRRWFESRSGEDDRRPAEWTEPHVHSAEWDDLRPDRHQWQRQVRPGVPHWCQVKMSHSLCGNCAAWAVKN